MKKLSLTLLLLLFIMSECFSQDLFWRAGMFTFFDNAEFGGSAVKIPQTMAGVMVMPEAGFVFDSVHRVCVGVNILHEFGSPYFIDKYYPTAYYEFKKKAIAFIMGSFPRAIALDEYPRLFFQDSLSYYRPNMSGMALLYKKGRNYADLWLDWTGRQSETVRETFLVGLSGRYHLGIFFVKHNSYMFHFAGRKNPLFTEALHDNILIETSAGLDLSGKTFLDRLEVSAGWVTGLERARADNTGWIDLHGMILETKAGYRFAGLSNTLYMGQGQMYFYTDHENDLYWGDPVYRAKVYDRADLYIRFLRSSKVNMELTWSVHFLEGKVYNEQMLKIKVNLEGGRNISLKRLAD